MKKDLPIVLLLLLASLNCRAGELLIENHLGINCIKHKVSIEETFYNVAQKFFVRPSTLAIVNNIEKTETIVSGSLLYIPLTETNFYTTKGLAGSRFAFEPALYKIENETKLSELADLFFVSIQNLKDWNTDRLPLHKGDKVIVGWVKFENEIEKIKTPLFVQKEKIIYGNSEEKRDAQKEIKELNTTVKTKSFPDYSLPKDAVPSKVGLNKDATEKKEVEKRIAKEKLRSNNSQNEKAKQKVKKKVVLSKRKEKVPQNTQANDENTNQKITNSEREFLKKRETNSKPKKKSGFISKVRKLTKNSYSRDKNKKAAPIDKKEQKIDREIVLKKSEEKLIKGEQLTKAKNIAVTNTNEVVDKTYSIEQEKPVLKEDATDPLYVENKMQRLTLLKSTTGRVSFFYSGTAGAKFYVFTNLAGKGDIIKVTNSSNGKYLLAQVIGPLPDADRRRGHIVSLSDNTKRLLRIKSKSFTGKINY